MSPHIPIWRHPAFALGRRDMGGPALGIAAWGLVTGVAMVKSGLSVPLALAMSLLVFAGSAQLAVLPLLVAGAPLWLVWATALCVNLRFVIISSQWRPHFGALPLARRARLSYFAADLNYVVFMRRFSPGQPAPDAWPYFWGGVTLNWSSWQLSSIAGILLARDIPPHWDIGFAGTLALLGLTLSLVADRATLIAAVVAGLAALASRSLPLRLNIVVAIAAAVAAGVVMDRMAARRAAAAGAAP